MVDLIASCDKMCAGDMLGISSFTAGNDWSMDADRVTSSTMPLLSSFRGSINHQTLDIDETLNVEGKRARVWFTMS